MIIETKNCTRLTYSEWIDNLKTETVGLFMLRALSWFKTTYGIEFASILSDNGVEFCTRGKNKTNHLVELIFKTLGIKHKRTRPYRPQTNGKIEAF